MMVTYHMYTFVETQCALVSCIVHKIYTYHDNNVVKDGKNMMSMRKLEEEE